MTGPAYAAAQAIADRLRDHFRCHISAARGQGLEGLAPEPDSQAIEWIVDAAFWASLRHEEGYSPKISLAFLPPSQTIRPLLFERPIRLTPGALTKLAPAVERPGIHLGVWRTDRDGDSLAQTEPGTPETPAAANGNSLVVWGATRTIPGYCFVLEVVAPGLLVIKHRSGGPGSGKFVNVAVLEGDEIKVLDPQATDFAGSPPLVKALLGIEAPNPAREPLNILLQLAVSMRAHARGGSMLVVPTGSVEWRESIVRPISYGVTPPFAELGRLLRDAGEPSDRRRQDALRHAVDAIAGLTAVDGATIISDAYDLLAFGAKITRRDVAAQVERVVSAEPIKGAVARVVSPAELGGTRHISAAQFTQDQHDSIALVASQDGRFTIFAWSPADEMVHAHRVEALLL